MRRACALLVASLLLLALPVPGAASAVSPEWKSTLAPGPTDVTSLAARGSLVVGGGRPAIKNTFSGGTQVVPSPRVPGLYVSPDHGATWQLGREPIHNPDGTVTFRAITETPDLLGLPPSGSDGYAFFGAAVWRSVDDGETWARVGQLPAAPTAFGALPDGRPVVGLSTGGVTISGDRGATWSAWLAGLPAARVNDLFVAVTPTQLREVLVATDQGLFTAQGSNPTSFTRTETGMLDGDARALAVAGRNNGTLVYVAMDAPVPGRTVLYQRWAVDAAWQARTPVYSQNLLPPVNPGALAVIDQPVPLAGAALGTTEVDEVYVGTTLGLFRSQVYVKLAPNTAWDMDGFAWERFDPEPGARGVTDVVVAGISPIDKRSRMVVAAVQRASVFVAGFWGGWFAAPGWFDELEGGRVCGGMLVHRAGDLFVACGRHVLRSADGGATWKGAGSGLPYVSAGIGDTPYLPLAQAANGSLWTSGFHYGLYRSDPEVASWSKVATFPGASAGQIAGHPTNAQTVFAAGLTTNGCCNNVLWRTRDSGLTWTPVLDPGASVTRIDVTPAAPDRIFVSSNAGVWRSNDAGDAWAKVATLPTGIGGVVMSPSDASVGYATGIVGSGRELWRTGDGGATWALVDTISFGRLSVAPWDADTVFLETTTEGVRISTDGGKTFEPFSAGLHGSYVSNVTFDPSGSGGVYVTAGVLGPGADPPSMWTYRADAAAA